MKSVLKTYVSFQFSPAFIHESEWNEKNLFEENPTPALAEGTLNRVLEQYTEVEVASRDLAALPVPKGTLHFCFYNRLTRTEYFNGRIISMCSEPIDEAGRLIEEPKCYFMSNTGKLLTISALQWGNEGAEGLTKETCQELLTIMDKRGSKRAILIDENVDRAVTYFLFEKDMLVSPNQVQMVDTEIPWPNK